jgi:hypothetical protein
LRIGGADFGDQASARRVDSEPVLRALELICRMFIKPPVLVVVDDVGLVAAMEYFIVSNSCGSR